MKSKLIALDIDGTILDITQGIAVPGSVREAVNEARANGVRVCLCSSRPCFFMDDALRYLDEVDALIGCSGAAIEISGEPFYRDILPPPLARSCIEIAQKWNFAVSFGGEEQILALKEEAADEIPEESPLFAFFGEKELYTMLDQTSVSCTYYFTRPGAPKEAVADVLSLPGATVNRASSDSFVITREGADKGTGVLRLAGHWNIPREAILAIGNDENDIPMYKVAGISVAVANANPEVLDYVDWIAPDVKDGGAAAAIRRYAL